MTHRLRIEQMLEERANRLTGLEKIQFKINTLYNFMLLVNSRDNTEEIMPVCKSIQASLHTKLRRLRRAEEAEREMAKHQIELAHRREVKMNKLLNTCFIFWKKDKVSNDTTKALEKFIAYYIEQKEMESCDFTMEAKRRFKKQAIEKFEAFRDQKQQLHMK